MPVSCFLLACLSYFYDSLLIFFLLVINRYSCHYDFFLFFFVYSLFFPLYLLFWLCLCFVFSLPVSATSKILSSFFFFLLWLFLVLSLWAFFIIFYFFVYSLFFPLSSLLIMPVLLSLCLSQLLPRTPLHIFFFLWSLFLPPFITIFFILFCLFFLFLYLLFSLIIRQTFSTCTESPSFTFPFILPFIRSHWLIKSSSSRFPSPYFSVISLPLHFGHLDVYHNAQRTNKYFFFFWDSQVSKFLRLFFIICWVTVQVFP